MEPKSSNDLPPSPPRKDAKRERENATIKDADKTDQSDRDAVHGGGDAIGLTKS